MIDIFTEVQHAQKRDKGTVAGYRDKSKGWIERQDRNKGTVAGNREVWARLKDRIEIKEQLQDIGKYGLG